MVIDGDEWRINVIYIYISLVLVYSIYLLVDNSDQW